MGLVPLSTKNVEKWRDDKVITEMALAKRN